ncbi:hypothetical protein WOLCODRAFT_58811, partial [Wolfiporia cocos MD-104 SS10]
NNAYVSQPPPAHHIHRDSEALPGARGGSSAADYSADVTNDSRTWTDNNQRRFGAGTDDSHIMAGGQHDSPGASRATSGSDAGHNAFNQERPLDVEPTSQGGVAIGGQDNLPEGRAKLTDKLIGKTQKVAGKATRNPEMHERGEL